MNRTIDISLPTPLFIIFLVLKLMHVIDWSWWWVTSPLWLPLVVILSILGAMVIIGTIAKALK